MTEPENNEPLPASVERVAAVGAIIVNWNSFELLTRCLEALADQRLGFARVVVIDNASQGQWERLTCRCPQNTRYIRLDYNAGFARANNIALQLLADCDWVALINPDAFLAADWLAQMMAAMHRWPDSSCFAGTLLKAGNGSVLDGLGDVYHVSGKAWRDAHGWAVQSFPVAEREIFSPCAGAAIYRREALLAVGGFDEDYFCYFEDVDLGFRLRLAGHRCMLIPGAVAHHVGSATTGGQHSNFSVYHGHRNLVWTYVKNMPGALFWALLPLHLMLNLLSLPYLALRGQGGAALRAKRDALKGIPAMWRKRRQIQRRRRASIAQIWRVLDKRLLPGRGARLR